MFVTSFVSFMSVAKSASVTSITLAYARALKTVEEMTVPVKLGTMDSVTAVPGEETRLLIEKAQKNLVSTQVEMEERGAAPVSKGQRLGMLTVKAGDQVISRVPLVAEMEVVRLNVLDLWKILLCRIAMAK